MTLVRFSLKHRKIKPNMCLLLQWKATNKCYFEVTNGSFYIDVIWNAKTNKLHTI